MIGNFSGVIKVGLLYIVAFRAIQYASYLQIWSINSRYWNFGFDGATFCRENEAFQCYEDELSQRDKIATGRYCSKWKEKKSSKFTCNLGQQIMVRVGWNILNSLNYSNSISAPATYVNWYIPKAQASINDVHNGAAGGPGLTPIDWILHVRTKNTIKAPVSWKTTECQSFNLILILSLKSLGQSVKYTSKVLLCLRTKFGANKLISYSVVLDH